ncbi:hypothetical protein E2C01_091077 [Portunus trituberculatus]|uniref:Uncharacterized protein n=1 Tax=Portunus trituberculatus TaxID=210409 RepID=A0A5B7JS16_PORTR|nr:hypothetical protein [Portunus trituberculatus]
MNQQPDPDCGLCWVGEGESIQQDSRQTLSVQLDSSHEEQCRAEQSRVKVGGGLSKQWCDGRQHRQECTSRLQTLAGQTCGREEVEGCGCVLDTEMYTDKYKMRERDIKQEINIH